MTGTSVDSLRITYARNFGDATIAWSGIRFLAVSQGQRPRSQAAWTGAKRGLLTGLGAAGIVGVAIAVGCSGEIACTGVAPLLVIPPAFVLTGTAAGAALDAAFPGEQWRGVIPPAQRNY